MPRITRIALAGGVILTGIAGAVLFRKPAGETSPPPLASDVPLRVRRPALPRAPSPDSVPRLLGQIDAIESTEDARVQPPTMPQATPGGFAAADPPSPAVKHTIRDGDTLISLARRYLGDGGRFQEIFAANRRRLPNADVLPIGVEIEIPIGPPAPPADDAPEQAPLVPIPQGSHGTRYTSRGRQ
ncbi:MAG TPA: LysM peptidoglycan-binding domain-containing protein [Pirellulales bacterium]|nr:LysM peptidoglycan-binding domain-containing protein [Pirellulales bacterium]